MYPFPFTLWPGIPIPAALVATVTATGRIVRWTTPAQVHSFESSMLAAISLRFVGRYTVSQLACGCFPAIAAEASNSGYRIHVSRGCGVSVWDSVAWAHRWQQLSSCATHASLRPVWCHATPMARVAFVLPTRREIPAGSGRAKWLGLTCRFRLDRHSFWTVVVKADGE